MSSKIVNLISVFVLAFALLIIFSNAMAKPLNRDEHTYCSAAVLLSQGQTIYKDFSYVAQLPYHPLLLSAIYKITGTTHYLLTARIVSCLADFLTVIFIILIYRKIFSNYVFSGLFFGLAAATLFLFNPLVNYITGLAWNHNIVICCVAISFWLYLTLDRTGKTDATLRSSEVSLRSTSYWKTALIAALLTFATCMRITTAFVGIVFFAALLFSHFKSKKDKFINVLVFLLSSLLVLAWPVWIIAEAPRAFYLNLFQIPVLNSQLLVRMGLFYSKLRLFFLVLSSVEYLFPLLIAIYVYSRLFSSRRQNVINSSIYLALLLPIVFFIIAFIPPTMWIQYLAIPVPFLLISLAFPLFFLRQSAESSHFKIASLLIAACVIITVFQHIIILEPVMKLSKTTSWVPVQVHNISEKITQNIDKSGPVLTVSPLYALEGSCRIYPQLSAGLFVYRIADNLTEDQRQITKTVGPASLKQMIEQNPPSAVIVGAEANSGFGNLENTLLTAVGPDWHRKTFETLVVYFRP
jgi:4-amino-4-deoxy-L-arabinose transferase-like glycosyltransferase